MPRSRLLWLLLFVTLPRDIRSQDTVQLTTGEVLSGPLVGLHSDGVALGARLIPWELCAANGLRVGAPKLLELGNGDRITATIVGWNGTQLHIATEFLGEGFISPTLLSARPAPETPAAPVDAEASLDQAILEIQDWHGKVALLGSFRAGNNDTSLFQLDASIGRQWAADRFNASAGVAYGQSEGETTASQARGGAKWDHFYTEDLYSYGRAEVEWDEIKNIDLRAVAGIGVGYTLWRGEGDHRLFQVEGGLDALYVQNTGQSATLDLAARGALVYKDVFFDDLLFTQEVEILTPIPETSAFILRTRTLLEMALSAHWYVQNLLELEYRGDPPGATKNLDIRLLVGLEYKF